MRTPRLKPLRRPKASAGGRASEAAGLFDELVVDSFAGGGGASLGIELALGRAVDVAINHDPIATAVHRANHPHTLHHCHDIWHAQPLKVTHGRPVGLLWASPDCRHHSRAKGGKPVEKKIRGLAWVIVKWAKAVAPRVICLENVREFQEWGPLVKLYDEEGRPRIGADGRPLMVPCKRRRGLTFKRWVGRLRKFGYHVEWRNLDAADYGAPTHRRRLFLVARRDGAPIVWPAPTHGPGRLPYRTAAECIDWSLPCHSIFLSKAEGRAAGVIRPLAEKTMRRIAMGLKRYVLDNPNPFIVRVDHGGDHFRGQSLDRPLATVTGAHGYGLVAPFLTAQYGEAPRQAPRSLRVDEPIPTVTPRDGGGFPLIQPVLVPSLVQYNQEKGAETRGQPLTEPLNTVVTENRFALAAASLISLNHGEKQWQAADEPLRTVTAGGFHHGLVAAFLTKYFGTGVGQPCGDPLHTVTARDRFGLVTVQGHDYAIADIGLRMLTPRELFRAQGFPDDYKVEIAYNGRPLAKSYQVRLCGNSVCPQVAEALVRANYEAGDVPKEQTA